MKMASLLLATTLLAAAGALAQGGPNDAQIAHIVVTANQVDIDAGKLAESKASTSDVKAFGKQMVTDHSGVNKQATALVKKLGVKPEDNPTSRTLKQGGDANLAHLKTLKGAAFDKAYVDHEVTYHQNVLDALDKTLIPDAKNDELKALLVKVRPAFVAHLEHAKMIQSKVGQVSARRFAPRAALLALALASSISGAAATQAVAIDGTAFSPADITAKRGDTVIWTNNDPFPHTVTARDGAFDSKAIAAGTSWRYVARKPGTFAYYCTLHPTMTGTLTVE